jgi:hypothetical protein
MLSQGVTIRHYGILLPANATLATKDSIGF